MHPTVCPDCRRDLLAKEYHPKDACATCDPRYNPTLTKKGIIRRGAEYTKAIENNSIKVLNGQRTIFSPRPAHRPRKDPSAIRRKYSLRLHPKTIDMLTSYAERSDKSESIGQFIDRIVAAALA